MPTTRILGLGLIALGLGIGALVPIFLIVYPAAGIAPADATNPEVVLPVLAAEPMLVTVPGLLEIVVHAIGAVAIAGLWLRFGTRSFLLGAATLGGLVWMSIDVVDNALTYHVAPILASDFVAGSTSSGTAFGRFTTITDAIRLGGHFVGGLWMIGLSVFAMRTGWLPRLVAWLGVVVGVIFAANLFVPAFMNVSFITVPAWLVICGAVVARTQVTTSATAPSGMVAAYASHD